MIKTVARLDRFGLVNREAWNRLERGQSRARAPAHAARAEAGAGEPASSMYSPGRGNLRGVRLHRAPSMH